MINFGRTNTNQLALWWRNIDKLLFILVISLIFLGIFFAYTSTSNIASEKIYNTDYLIIKYILKAIQELESIKNRKRFVFRNQPIQSITADLINLMNLLVL